MNRAESSAGLLAPRIALLHLCALVVLRLLFAISRFLVVVSFELFVRFVNRILERITSTFFRI